MNPDCEFHPTSCGEICTSECQHSISQEWKSIRTCLKTGLFSAKIQECPGIRWTSGSQPTRNTTSLPDSHSIREFLQGENMKNYEADFHYEHIHLNQG